MNAKPTEALQDIQIQEEIWKDIKGYEGRYQVSNMGRVKSLERTIIDKNGRKQRRKSCLFKPHKPQKVTCKSISTTIVANEKPLKYIALSAKYFTKILKTNQKLTILMKINQTTEFVIWNG